MNGYELISKLVESLAWPAASIVLVVLMRSPISSLLQTLSKLKYKDLELDFTKELKAVKEAAEKVAESDVGVTSIEDYAYLKDAIEVAKISPQSAIALVWTNLSSELSAIAHKEGMQAMSRGGISDFKILNTLAEKKILDRNQLQLLDAMRQLRNKAIHHHSEALSLKEGDALEFIGNAGLILNQLSGS